MEIKTTVTVTAATGTQYEEENKMTNLYGYKSEEALKEAIECVVSKHYEEIKRQLEAGEWCDETIESVRSNFMHRMISRGVPLSLAEDVAWDTVAYVLIDKETDSLLATLEPVEVDERYRMNGRY